MKRLGKNISLYHTTTVSSFQQIVKDKYLIPQKNTGAGINYKNPTKEEINYFSQHVFLCTTLNKAISYIDYYKEKEKENYVVILELNIPINKLLPEKSDCYDCKNWEESSSQIQQICVKGKIPTESITSVYVYDIEKKDSKKINIQK